MQVVLAGAAILVQLHIDAACQKHRSQHAPHCKQAQQDHKQSVQTGEPAGGGDVHVGPYTGILGQKAVWVDLILRRGAAETVSE